MRQSLPLHHDLPPLLPQHAAAGSDTARYHSVITKPEPNNKYSNTHRSKLKFILFIHTNLVVEGSFDSHHISLALQPTIDTKHITYLMIASSFKGITSVPNIAERYSIVGFVVI